MITTRNADVLPAGARRIDIDAMRGDEATALVGFGLPPGSDEALRALAARLGEWPLLLKLANAALRDRTHSGGQALSAALAYINKALDRLWANGTIKTLQRIWLARATGAPVLK